MKNLFQKSLTATFALTLVFSTAARAADQSSGCGAGWYVFKKNSLLSSFARNFTNVTFSNTIAMTSGTSNCAPHSIVKNEKMEIYYAEANQQNLAVEMAEGEGESLRTFASILGCSDSSFGEFSKAMREDYSKVLPYSNLDPAQAPGFVKRVKETIKSRPSLRSSCTAVI